MHPACGTEYLKRLLRGGVREQRRAQRLHAFAEDAGPDSGDILDRDGDWDADAETDAAGDEYADAGGEEDLEDAEDPDEMDFEYAAVLFLNALSALSPVTHPSSGTLQFCVHFLSS